MNKILIKTPDKCIYKAFDNNYNKEVLIKQYSIKKSQHAFNEYTLLSSLPENDSIINKPIIFETIDYTFVIYENIYPTDLYYIINYYNKKKINIPLDYCLYIFKKVIQISNFLLKNNILYCDYKPENICVKQNGEIVLIDFDHSRFTTIESNEPTGTLIYFAPELLEFSIPNDIKSDIWSIGCLFLECLSGCLPWYEVKKKEVLLGCICAINIRETIMKNISNSVIKLKNDNINCVINNNEKIKNYTTFFDSIICVDRKKRSNLEEIMKNNLFKSIEYNEINIVKEIILSQPTKQFPLMNSSNF